MIMNEYLDKKLRLTNMHDEKPKIWSMGHTWKKKKNKKMYNFIPSETWGKLKWIREQPSYLIDINQD